jgi:hypothetical protein
MSTETKSPHGLTTQPTLANVLDRLPLVTNLSERRRKELASDVRSFCRIVELPVDRVVASTPVLRQLAERANPAARRVTHRRWSNILSGLRKALQLTGIRQTKFGLLPRPASIWEELLTRIASEKRRIVFSRFARYCTDLAIMPEQVNDAIICQFRQALEGEVFSDPASKIASLCRAWNQCATTHSSWPQQRLTVPNRARTYSLPWSAYPVGFRAEVEHYLAQSLAPDPLDPDAPPAVRPSTIVTRRQRLREMAYGRVARGTPASDLLGLGDIVRPAALLDSLRFFVDRAGNTLPRHVIEKAILGRSIARNFLKLSAAELAELDRICMPIRRQLAKDAKKRADREKPTAANPIPRREKSRSPPGSSPTASCASKALPYRLAERADGANCRGDRAFDHDAAPKQQHSMSLIFRALCKSPFQRSLCDAPSASGAAGQKLSRSGVSLTRTHNGASEELHGCLSTDPLSRSRNRSVVSRGKRPAKGHLWFPAADHRRNPR